MRIALFTFFACVSTLIALSQRNIRYVFSDPVEISVDSCITKIEKSNQDFHFYLLLESDSSLYRLTIGEYTDRESKNMIKWITQTSRYAAINKRSIPLIFDYDMKFGIKSESEPGSFRNRDGEITRVKLLIHGPTIYFDRFGKLVKEEDWWLKQKRFME